MAIYVYIDESGDLGFHPSKSSTHFIATALFISDFSKLDRIIKKLRRGSFQKELKYCSEIKGYKSSEALKRKMLSRLNEETGFQVVHIILPKKNLSPDFRENKHLLYNYVIGKIAENIPVANSVLIVRIDKSKEKQSLRDDFDHHFKSVLKSFSSCTLQNGIIYHSDSKSWAGLQFADVLAWAEYQKICNSNSQYIELIDFEKQNEHFIKKYEK